MRTNQQTTLSDDLLLMVGNDDAEAFRTLYELTDQAIFGYAFSILKNKHDAEDVMQDTYIRIRESASTYQPYGKPMAWIFTITRNLCLMKFRQNEKTIGILSEELENMESLSYIENTEDRLALQAAFEILTEEERQIVILHAVTGMKHREIAGSLQKPVGSVLAKYHRAIKKLKNHLA